MAEFNAYTHDLAAAVDLRRLSSPDQAVDHRDGLAAMMAFLVVYAETAAAGEPATWNGLRQPRVARTISALWGRAEKVMARSCGIPNFGTSDRTYLARVCAADARSAIGQVLGRAPVCPVACLETAFVREQTSPEPQGPEPTSTEQTSTVDADEASAAVEAAETSPDTGFDDTPTGTVSPTRPRHPFAGNAGPRRHRLRSDD